MKRLTASVLASAAGVALIMAATPQASFAAEGGKKIANDVGLVALTEDSGYACSGTMISAEWLITSASCENIDTAVIGGSESSPGETVKVVEQKVAPKASAGGQMKALRLEKPVKVPHLELNREQIKKGDVVTVVAFLDDENSGKACNPSLPTKGATSGDVPVAAVGGNEKLWNIRMDQWPKDMKMNLLRDNGAPVIKDGKLIGVVNGGGWKGMFVDAVEAELDWIAPLVK